MAVYPLQSSNVFSYTFAAQGNTHFHYLVAGNNNPVLNIGGQSWTIECWLKPAGTGNYANYYSIFSKRRGAGATKGTDISYLGYFDVTTGFVGYYDGGAGAGTLSSTRLTSNAWSHVAWVFNQGANLRIFVNGTNVATNSAITTTANIDSQFFIGLNPGQNSQYFGDISNFRIVSGQALYSGESFNVSTYPMQLPNNSIGPHVGTGNVAASLTGNVVLLTCNDQIIKSNGNVRINGTSTNSDISVNGFVYPHAVDTNELQNFSYFFPGNTVGSNGANGTVLVTSTTNSLNLNADFTIETWYYPINNSPFPPSSNGSVLFNGTNQYLTVPSTSAFAFGTGNFTIEAWVYTTPIRGGGVTQDKFIFGGFSLSPAMVFFITNDSNAPALWDGTTQWTASDGIPPNKWTHIAFTRSGTSANFYIDGKLNRTLSSFSTNFTGSAATYIGGSGSTLDRYFPGSISNLRVVNGVAVYTGNFTVPTSPLTTTQSSSTNIAAITGTQTVLLACQNKSGATFTDSSSNNFSITGTNTPVNQNIPVSTGVILERGLGSVGNNNASYILLWDGQNNSINFASANANNVAYSVGSLTGAAGNVGIPTINSWNHIAVTRAGNTYRGFLNGNLNLTITNNANTPYAALGRGLTIGGMFNNGQTYATGIPANTITGFISNLRIIRGNSVYNAAFTPARTQLPNVTNTILLTALTPSYEDLSGTHTLATNGASEIIFSPSSPFTANAVINANATTAFTQNRELGQDEGQIYDKFDYRNFGQMVNIYAALAQDAGRIYDKFDYRNFGQMQNIYAALAQDAGRIYDKFDSGSFAAPPRSEAFTSGQDQGRIYDKFDYRNFGQMVNIYPALGQDEGRIYSKQNMGGGFAYIPVGGAGGAGTGTANIEYEFWS